MVEESKGTLAGKYVAEWAALMAETQSEAAEVTQARQTEEGPIRLQRKIQRQRTAEHVDARIAFRCDGCLMPNPNNSAV